MSPLSDPILMLKIALGWGIGFLLLMSALCIHNRVMEGDWTAALLGGNGVVHVALYLGLLWGGYNAFTGAGFGSLPALLVFGALITLAAYKWQESKAPYGERVMVVLVESFETIMGSVSGTLSFLRVAAFSLNHVALAVAVFTLADMLGPAGHWIMVVFGNLFILVLEGGIVAIQVLRLEYYEGFTRFYSGDGREFRPLRLNRGDAIAPHPQAELASNH
jgi:V/A-type H+-transporting ATPase subunit I